MYNESKNSAEICSLINADIITFWQIFVIDEESMMNFKRCKLVYLYSCKPFGGPPTMDQTQNLGSNETRPNMVLNMILPINDLQIQNEHAERAVKHFNFAKQQWSRCIRFTIPARQSKCV